MATNNVTPATTDECNVSVGFFGGGMMAEAIIRGILSKSLLSPARISVSEPSEARRAILSEIGVFVTTEAREMLSRSDVVFIAVKPDIVPIILWDVKRMEDASGIGGQLYVSICAGVTMTALSGGVKGRKVCRVMPNQPCLVGAAASAFCMSESCDASDRQTVHSLMGACGTVVELPEKNLDAVTGLSGSGPAFVFTMIEAMADAGVANGIARPVARVLAAQTVFGAAKMAVVEGETHVAELRNRVESPGGTTIAGSCALERGGFRAAVIDAVTAAAKRSADLGKK